MTYCTAASRMMPQSGAVVSRFGRDGAIDLMEAGGGYEASYRLPIPTFSRVYCFGVTFRKAQGRPVRCLKPSVVLRRIARRPEGSTSHRNERWPQC